jgi:hypothetical protein
MSIRQLLLAIALAASSAGYCAETEQPFEVLANGTVRHTASNWLFPETIGNFTRTGQPTARSTLASAEYSRPVEGVTVRASITIIPSSGANDDAHYEQLKQATAETYKSRIATLLWSDGPFRVMDNPKLVGRKAFYKLGVGSVTGLSNLYQVGAGAWTVRVRVSSAVANPEVLKDVDAFVRSQSWDRFGLPADFCSGLGCDGKAVAFHASGEEQFAILGLENKQLELFPETRTQCGPGFFSSIPRNAPSLAESGQKSSFELLGTCRGDKNARVSVVRVDYPAETLKRSEMEGVDGLSLNGPFVFVAFMDGKRTYLGQMHDGFPSAEQLSTMATEMTRDRSRDFATANKKAKDMKPVLWLK